MSDVRKIEIILTPPGGTRFLWAKRLLFTAVAVILPIGLGVAVDSRPMQWIGFFMSVLLLLAIGKMMSRDMHFMTTDAAREYLDRIDRGEI